ncbi:uncharacterized protein BDR25DRAFT_119801 [Lindgomyces ingoldianus]|uniref:Uncharacterized protein n=1 Tax=Lindgomyces ingoldianus TaxID=673940 RepID=A0ACB6R532_9PLEO|nr:uncharacterized protein BDR25DRAFT_119801 [Lindgomyces ingoldianus]KAF2474182.1 hypothetical protein BDR25DRAFT_119801 [Lindgomyces ingoldianus]
MAETLQTALTVLYYVCWPFIKLVHGISYILSPFWAIAQFVLLPFTHLVHILLNIVLFPFRLQLLERVETIYIYLGIAGLIGCITGAILHLSFNFLSSTLCIDAAAGAKPRLKGRSAAEYRAARRRRKFEALDHPSTPPMAMRGGPPYSQRGLASQTIVEEEDSDF